VSEQAQWAPYYRDSVAETLLTPHLAWLAKRAVVRNYSIARVDAHASQCAIINR